MNNETTEPQLLEAEWDADRVLELFRDLQLGAEVQHVQVRTTSATGADDRAVTLGEARDLFQSGEAKAIQIRYAFDGQSWCDTLMIGPAATRVIRSTQP